MATEGTKRPIKIFDFRGAWLPSISPFIAGEKNFSALQNQIPGPDGMQGCLGYSKITTTALTSAYRKASAGIQIRGRFTTLSRILVQAINDAGTASAVLEQIADAATEDVPNQQDFETTPIHVDASGAGQGRFARWPKNQLAYCNGKESLVYAGDEMYPAGFMIADSPMADPLTNPENYTDAVTNDLQTSGNVAPVGTTADAYTKLFLALTGTAGATITDASPSSHGTATKVGTADISTAQSKFGSGSLSTPAVGDRIYYASHADFSPPTTGKITYETQHYLPSTTNYLSSGSCVFNNNGTSAHTIIVAGNQSSVAWLQAGRCIAAAGIGGPWTIGSIAYSSSSDTTIITLAASDTVTSQTVTTVIAECLSVMGRYEDVSNYWYVCYIAGSGYQLSCVTAGVEASGYINAHAVVGFNHVVAHCDGTYLYLAVNGHFDQASSGTATFPSLSAPYFIGSTQRGSTLYTGSPGCYFAQARISHINRWTGDFPTPTTPYRTTAMVWVVFTTRPIQAVCYYLSNVNSVSGATITGNVWNGVEMAPLTITDNTAGLSVSGRKTSFASTVDSAKPRLMEGNLYYCYQFELSSGSAEVYQVTVDAPFQPIRDLWDGVLRPVVDCRHYHSSAWIDDTMLVSEEVPEGVDTSYVSYYVADIGGLTTTEYVDIAVSDRACAFKITLYERQSGKVNSTTAVVTPHYWGGKDFIAPSGKIDSTASSGITFAQSGFISWTPPAYGEEFQKTAFGTTLWRYRLTFSATLSSAVWIDKIEAVPAPGMNNLAYKFPFAYQNRPMLCNLTSTKEGNRVDYPVTNTTEAWNGDQSSFGDGKGSLYIGGQEELTGACEIYVRLSSSIYVFALFFKDYEVHILNGSDYDTYKSYPLDNKIGCPAPLTIDTFHLVAPRKGGDQQNSRSSIAAWLSYFGPYMFDSGALMPMPGIECYFDRNDSRCINFEYIHVSRGWFDPDLPQYNLQIPSGVNQTTNNVWLVFDFKEERWYHRVPSVEESPYLDGVVRVSDVHEKQYVYGFRDNGHVMRLNNGTTYDGVAIEQFVESGEILPGDLWNMGKFQRLKVLLKPITEDADLTVTLYKNGSSTGQVIATFPMKGTGDYFLRYNKPLSPDAFWSCRVRFSASTSATKKGMQLLGWGIKHSIESEDNHNG